MFVCDFTAHDPLPIGLVDADGHRLLSEYVEWFWLPVLGPTALCLLRKLALRGQRPPLAYDLPELARSLGVGYHQGRNSPLNRTLERLVMFHVASWDGHTLHVRRCLPTLPARHVDRLPERLRAVHAEYLAVSADRKVLLGVGS